MLLGVRRIAGCLVVSLAIVALVSCQSRHLPESKYFDNGKEAAVALAELKERPIDEAYRAYIYAMDVIHPPRIEMVSAITDRGEQAIPFMMDTLANQKYDEHIYYDLFVFESFSMSKQYDVKSNQLAMNEIASAIRRIKTKHVKEMALEMQSRIQNGVRQ